MPRLGAACYVCWPVAALRSDPFTRKRVPLLLFVGALALYLLTSYAGIRSPDAEVVFEVCDSLASRGELAVESESAWPGFGLAPGRDGRLYAIFGPAQSLACAPLLATVDALAGAGVFDRWPAAVQPSHYLGQGSRAFMAGEPPRPRAAHLRRSLVAWVFNSVVGAFGVLAFFLCARRLSPAGPAPLAAAILYGAGTIAWVYSGTFFSEPLATLFVLLALERLLALRGASAPRPRFAPVASGLWLGAAVATHITAVLFVPFFALLPLGSRRGGARPRRGVLLFCLGIGAVLAALGAYNTVRFGSPFETGRGVGDLAETFGYGHFVAPWRGLSGLLGGPATGLLIFCPLVAWGLIAWPRLHRRDPVLSLVLLGAAAVRLVFIASRSDWHGGFGLGPRYLVMVVPLLLLPLVPTFEECTGGVGWRRLAPMLVAAWAAVSQQAAYAFGEVFSFQTMVRDWVISTHGNVYAALYEEWDLSPALFVLKGHRGAYALEAVPLSNMALWGLAIALLALALMVGLGLIERRGGGSEPDPRRVSERPPPADA